MKRLSDARYLQADTLLATRERIYFLGKQALPPLRDHFGIDQRRLYQSRSAETMQLLLHPLMVSECTVRFTEAIRTSAVETPDLAPLGVPFYHTHAVEDASRQKHDDTPVGRSVERPWRRGLCLETSSEPEGKN